MSKASPADRLYSKDHEWIIDQGGGMAVVGITDYAQQMLTDIVFVELPPIGKIVAQDGQLAVIESVKSVSDVYSPVSGEVIDINKTLEDAPELINQDALGKGWIAKLKLENAAELTSLLSAADYDAWVNEEKH